MKSACHSSSRGVSRQPAVHPNFSAALNSGQAFAAMDRLLDEARSGSFYPRQPDMFVEAIQYNANTLGHYLPHAFMVMPNHFHLLATPAVSLRKPTKSLKGITVHALSIFICAFPFNNLHPKPDCANKHACKP